MICFSNRQLSLVDEAESNILDAYAGTSFEKEIRMSYARKRTKLRRLRKDAGLAPMK
jgi:hypothetical protein